MIKENHKIEKACMSIKLGEKIQILDGLTYSPDNVTKDITKLKVLRSSNIKDSSFTYKDMVYVDGITISEERYTRKGDILMCVRNGSTSLIGKCCLINGDIKNATHGAFMTIIRTCEPDYYYHLLNTRQAKKEIQKDLGATINQITKGNLSKFKFNIHQDREYRYKIGNLLSSVDKLIEMNDSLIENHKNSILEYKNILLGNKNNDTFKSVKLSEYLSSATKKSEVENQYPLLTSSKNGIRLQSEYFNGDVVTKSNIGNKIIVNGQITYRSMSDTGSFTFNIQNIVDVGLVSSAYPVMDCKKINKKYLVHSLNESEYFKKQLMKINEGSTRMALPFSKLIEMEILINESLQNNFLLVLLENLEEQLNYYIELQDRYCMIKKYYLNQIFS